MSLRKDDKLMKIISNSLVDLPSPSSLSYFWNFGSLLGIFLGVQILSGLFLSFHFSGEVNLSFDSIIHMMRDMNYGWLLRVIHANGASMFFLLMYIHMGRGMYYSSYRYKKTWLSGVTIFLLAMATAFLGYVLPWGQMSFWAATVITNLLSAIPYIGTLMVEWVWGGFAVGNPTLIRFFAFHFILPFIIMFMVILHLFFLHETGSSNSIGMMSDCDKVYFHPYYSIKDMYGFGLFFMFFMLICMMMPYIFMDVENFISSDPLVTPVHIQPEWYFLFAYTILRSVPSKIGGVVALLMSVIILYFFPLLLNQKFRSSYFYNIIKYMFWIFVVNWLLLTWIGACVVEIPFSILGMLFSINYFLIFIVIWMFYEIQDLFFM
uniref:Cytochrome b n=1 Tax=Cheliceroides longipalpis TaxID=1560386 RepID=A0A481N029_9ARAC|nr:cytochrome b [Cheliceroides longipalpis]QAU56490.1 cytochrome b [Cheliceroides longipalpis]